MPQPGVGTTGGPNVTGGPGGTTNPINVPPGFPPPPPGSTDPPPAAPPGSTFPAGTTSLPAGTVLPKVVVGMPNCQQLTWCEFSLTLSQAKPYVVDVMWSTNDNPNSVVSIPQGSIRAIPNVDYTPGSGLVRILPGEVVRKFYVLNINPDPNRNVVIPFLFRSCSYGGVPVPCSTYFY